MSLEYCDGLSNDRRRVELNRTGIGISDNSCCRPLVFQVRKKLKQLTIFRLSREIDAVEVFCDKTPEQLTAFWKVVVMGEFQFHCYIHTPQKSW